MKHKFRAALRFAGSIILLWCTALLCRRLGSNRATAAIVLLLEVLAIATWGDWILALLSSTVASLAFSYYFIEVPGSSRIDTAEGVITFAAMALTAFTGSRLSIQAQRRAAEAIHRREEMERLNQFGRVLIAANNPAEAAQDAVQKVVELFGIRGAVLRIAGARHAFQWGSISFDEVSVIPLDSDYGSDVLELHGTQPSEEVRNTLASIIRLVLERARSAEERAQIEAIRRGEELRTTVLNSMAHNFKTPLTSIKAASSSLLQSGLISSPRERELIVVIDEEADRLNRMIRESLDLAKLEARRANPMSEECVIPEIIDRVAARMSRYFGQVVDNAWKYSMPGAPIRISVALTHSSMILTVWNEGSEIPADERDRIFDRFYRGSKDRNRVEGAGVGLAVARAIAEVCKGRIWLDVEPLGPAFRFELPLEETMGRTLDRKQHYITH
jgi:two-component system sensor histidine kinase KdpD